MCGKVRRWNQCREAEEAESVWGEGEEEGSLWGEGEESAKRRRRRRVIESQAMQLVTHSRYIVYSPSCMQLDVGVGFKASAPVVPMMHGVTVDMMAPPLDNVAVCSLATGNLWVIAFNCEDS